MTDPSSDSGDGGWLVAGSSSPDDVRRYYDALADRYDSTLEEWGYDAPVRVAELLLTELGTRTGSVLDAGCGTGLGGLALQAAGFTGSITGIDLSGASLASAAARQLYDDLSIADLQQPLAYAMASFDAVMCVGVLTYVPDVRQVWREFCRVLRPDGVMVCTQRADVWTERRCASIAGELERDGTWKVVALTAATHYLPGNRDFADTIGVRYLAARRR